MTNEQWFIELPTEEKAKFIAVQGEYNTKQNMHLMLYATAKTLEKWLKEEHK